MNKAVFSEEPEVLQKDTDGSTLYRWGIESYTNDDGDILWSCYECRIYTTPTATALKKAAIAARWPADIEAKLINDNISAMIDTGSADASYLEFLVERTAIKAGIDAALHD